tara:strand:+ start:5593 stop:5736 length:144 start_codon:yes stop_codon:yes gene_type:complete
MTPQQAYEILDKMVAQVHLNREDHATVTMALEIIKGMVDKSKSKKEK